MPDQTPPPVQLATLPADTLRAEQWRLALLLLTASTRPLTLDEISAEIHLLSQTIAAATYSWQ